MKILFLLRRWHRPSICESIETRMVSIFWAHSLTLIVTHIPLIYRCPTKKSGHRKAHTIQYPWFRGQLTKVLRVMNPGVIGGCRHRAIMPILYIDIKGWEWSSPIHHRVQWWWNIPTISMSKTWLTLWLLPLSVTRYVPVPSRFHWSETDQTPESQKAYGTRH